MKPKQLSSSIFSGLFLAMAVFSVAVHAQWSVSLETTNLSFAEFEFGVADGATAGWDPALEDPLPPALPNGAISGFSVNGAPFPFITLQDFRGLGTHDAVFAFSYSLAEGGTATLDWSASQGSAPIGDIVVNSASGANLLGPGNTMADVRSLELKPSRDGVSTIYFILGNPRPVARDDVGYMLNLGAGSTVDIDVLANDYSPALSALEVVDPVVAVPARGAATVLTPPNMINYEPELNFFGTDTFQYKATDGISDSEAATVTVYANQNVVIRPRADQEPGKPGEEVTVTVDVETNPLLASLALQIVLPRTNQNPPQIWGFVGATYDDGGPGAAVVPSVNDDGMGTVTLGFASPPTSLTLTLAAPNVSVASSPIVFDKAAETVAALETNSFPDALPDVKVAMLFGTLDVDENGQVNMNDVIFIFRRAILGAAPGTLDITQPIADNIDGLGDMLDVDDNGQINMNDVIFIFRRAILGAAPGTLDITQTIADNVDAMTP